MLCRKRRPSPPAHAIEPPRQLPRAYDDTRLAIPSAVAVNCRGTSFVTSKPTLLRLGPCYLATLAEIDTSEAIFLDYSPAAFSVVLDALTLAQHRLSQALLHLDRSRTAVVDLPALLHFLGLGWTLGVHLPLPAAPEVDTPAADKWAHDRYWGGLGLAYHGEAGIFFHLARRALSSYPQADPNDLDFKCLPLPFSFHQYDADVPLLDGEQYHDIPAYAEPGCIPVSLENEASVEHLWGRSWLFKRLASIYMLPLQGREDRGEFVPLHERSAAVVDLGERRALCCQGLVLRIWRRQDGQQDCHDMLTVEVVSDLDVEQAPKTILCQKIWLKSGYSTYCRLHVPTEAQRLARIFRLKLSPFQAEQQVYAGGDFHSLYRLEQIELFGSLLDIPSELVPDDRLLHTFVVDKSASNVLRVRRRCPP